HAKPHTRAPLPRSSLVARMRAPSRDRRPSLAQRLGYPHLGLVSSCLGPVPRALAWFSSAKLGFLGLGLVSLALAEFPRSWLGFSRPCLGLLGLGRVFLVFGLVFLVPWLGFTLPRLGFSNVGLVSPHVVAFLARASAKR